MPKPTCKIPGLPATTLLFDEATGLTRACVNAAELTGIRTACVFTLVVIVLCKAGLTGP